MAAPRQQIGANNTHQWVSQILDRTTDDIRELDVRVTQNEKDIADLQGSGGGTNNALVYRGEWDAKTNTPTLGDSGAGGVTGDYYVVSVSGTTSVDGNATWTVDDWISHNGTTWNKSNHNFSGSLHDAVLTGTTRIENVIGETQSYVGAGPHDIATDGKTNATVTSTVPSVVTLPATPDDGFQQRVINMSTGVIDVVPQAPDQIEDFGAGVAMQLPRYLDKATLLYVGGIWHLI